jgi:amidase
LESLGHNVEYSAPTALTEPEFGDKFVVGMVANVAADVTYLESVVGHTFGEGDLEPENLFYVMLGKGLNATGYLDALTWMHGFQRRMANWWAPTADGGGGFDLLLTPTIGIAPPPIGWIGEPTETPGERVRSVMQYTAQFNVTGQPGISLPLHVSANGLPVGVQLVAGFGCEDVLIRIASQIELAAPWSHLAPVYR